MDITHAISISISIHPYIISMDGHLDDGYPWLSLDDVTALHNKLLAKLNIRPNDVQFWCHDRCPG